jgi:transposase-like protein
VPVYCPQCASNQVVERGKPDTGQQRYLCQTDACLQQTFILDYRYWGRLPEVKRRIIDMALNGSGLRDTARVLGISKDTVLSTLQKKRATSRRSTHRYSRP